MVHLAIQNPNGDRIKNAKSTFFKKLKLVVTNITVEPVFVFFLLPSVVTLIATNNLNLQKACRVNLKLDDEVCDGLKNRDPSKFNESDEVAVQKLVSTMNIWKTCIRSVFPAILLAFFGSWSDRHERRIPLMIVPLVGDVVFCIGVILCTYFFDEIRMEYTGLVEIVPIALTGGWAVMSMAVYSYVSGITTRETRTIRLGIVYVVYNLSMTAGFSLSGILYTTTGFYGVYSFCLVLYSIGLLYCIFILKEYNDDIISEDSTDKKKVDFLKDIFSTTYIVETFKYAFKKRDDRWRLKIGAIIVTGILLIGPIVGEFQVTYLYTRHVYNWNEIDFSIFFAYDMVVHMLGTVLSLGLFSKFLKLDDGILGLISCVSKILGGFLYAFAPTTEVFYIGAVVEMLSGTGHIALRSITSKIVPSEELGKINSILGLFESLALLIYGPLYNYTYRSTIDSVPGTYFVLGAILTIPATFLFLWLSYEEKKTIVISKNT